MRHPGKTQRIRHQLVLLAARIMAEEGVSDFHTAKRKAAKRLGITHERNMPRNVEIELALRDYQTLFRQDKQPLRLRTLRETALEVMQLLKNFSPRLVGPVLRGTADLHSALNIHLFTDNSEEINWILMEHHIPFNVGEHQYRFGVENETKKYPFITTSHGDIEIKMVVFPEKGIRQPPNSPLDNKPIQRASISAVEKLLQERRTNVC